MMVGAAIEALFRKPAGDQLIVKGPGTLCCTLNWKPSVLHRVVSAGSVRL